MAKNALLLSALFLLTAASEAFVGLRTRVAPRSLTSNSKHQMLPIDGLAEAYNGALSCHPFMTASITAGCLSGVGDSIAQWQERKTLRSQPPPLILTPDYHLQEPQYVEPPFDAVRTLRFVVKGLGGGIIWLLWYQLADHMTHWLLSPWSIISDTAGFESFFESSAAASLSSQHIHMVTTALSVLLDQFVASPIVIAFWEIPVPLVLVAATNSITDMANKEHHHKDTHSHAHTPLVPMIEGHVRSQLLELLIENAKVWTLANMVIYSLPMEYRVLASSMTDVFWQSILSGRVNVMDEEEASVYVLADTASSILEEDLLEVPFYRMGDAGLVPEMDQGMILGEDSDEPVAVDYGRMRLGGTALNATQGLEAAY